MAVYFCGVRASDVARNGKHSPRIFRERELRMTIRQLALYLRFILPVLSILLFSTISMGQGLDYPQTRKDSQVDDYHGVKVADPYRWLEDDNSAETAKWVEAENKVTFGYLGKIPYRTQVKTRLEQLFNFPKYTPAFRKGEYLFFTKNDGLQNQNVVYAQRARQKCCWIRTSSPGTGRRGWARSTCPRTGVTQRMEFPWVDRTGRKGM